MFTTAERLGPLCVCFEGMEEVFWSEGDGEDGSDGFNGSDEFDGPDGASGTINLVVLVTKRFSAFREISVLVTTSPLL